MTSRPTTTAIVTAAALLAGCGIPNPGASTTPRHTGGPTLPTGVRTPAGVVATQRTAAMRIAVDYTLTQATWSADTYVAQRARLAQLATGVAAAQLTSRDGQPPAAVAAQLAAARASSRASLLGTDGPTTDNEVVVAYKVRATGTGRNPRRADYHLAHLTLTRQNRAWRVARFAVQP